jgi:hypothetical protein
MMKKIALILSMIMLVCGSAYADKKKKLNEDTDKFRYDIEYCKTASDGMVMVKVWSYSKKADLAVAQARKNAVHGIMFRGFSSADPNYSSMQPLVKDPSIESVKADFFQAFFDDATGEYARYAPSVIESSKKVIKVGKEFKAGVVVKVNVKLLRQHLEQAGIIKPLGGGLF